VLSAIGLLALASAAMRWPNLRDLPIFGDEAVFLRLARLVRSDSVANLWISLRVPNAPLHTWLLALSLPLSTDPVQAGRILSVILGSLLAPALAWTVWRTAAAFRWARDRAAVAAFAAGVLTALSPFLVFAHRLVRLEALFAFEVALCAGLSVELARRARSGESLAVRTMAFGALMGATMLTRQAVSYPLWLLPVIAFALIPGKTGAKRLAISLGAASAVGAALWIPMLLAPAWPDLAARLFYLSVARPPLSIAGRLTLLARNATLALESFWKYLTPPVALAVVVAIGFLAVRHRRLFALFTAWELLLLLPTVLFAVDYFPRYALPAALPLIAAAGFGFGAAWSRARVEAVALFVAVLMWGAVEIARGERGWRSWHLLPLDRQQFVSGWTAGLASERAASFLEERAREGPIAVIVPHVSGNPSDAVWLLLERNPRVRIFYAEDFLRLPATRVRGDVWISAPAAALPARLPVFFVSQDPAFLGREGWTPASKVLLPLNPGARLVARFENLPDERGRVESAVALYSLR